jgi:hypothetical protein
LTKTYHCTYKETAPVSKNKTGKKRSQNDIIDAKLKRRSLLTWGVADTITPCLFLTSCYLVARGGGDGPKPNKYLDENTAYLGPGSPKIGELGNVGPRDQPMWLSFLVARIVNKMRKLKGRC